MTSMTPSEHPGSPSRALWRGVLTRRVLPLGGLAVLIALGMSTGAPAQPANGSKTLRFNVATESIVAADPRFPQPGDTLTETSRNSRGGRTIGSDYTACLLINSHGDLQCTGAVGLPHGTIQIAFHQTLAGTNLVAAIAGGTGTYVGARGYFALTQTSNDHYRAIGHLL